MTLDIGYHNIVEMMNSTFLILDIGVYSFLTVAGKSMRWTDSLSRRADCAERVEKDNENQVMLKKEWLEIRAIKKTQLLIERAKKLLRKLKNQKKQNIMK